MFAVANLSNIWMLATRSAREALQSSYRPVVGWMDPASGDGAWRAEVEPDKPLTCTSQQCCPLNTNRLSEVALQGHVDFTKIAFDPERRRTM